MKTSAAAIYQFALPMFMAVVAIADRACIQQRPLTMGMS
jgi:hypothetical protein